LFLAATVSALDLRRAEANTLVIYTTSALKDYLDQSIVPAFEAQYGLHVKIIYALPAGDEYYRVLMTRDRPEADVFLHASPLFIEKGYESGVFETYPAPGGADFPGELQRTGPGGNIWTAFARSPLVEVYSPKQAGPPDLNHTSLRFGLPHPLLSNNGVYAAMFFEQASPAAGRKAVDLAVEAVARLYKETRGAKISYALPVVDHENITTNVLFSVGLVKHHPHPGALQFIQFLFTSKSQDALAKSFLRPTVRGHADPAGSLDTSHAQMLLFDWSRWHDLEETLPSYVVSS